MPVRRFAAFVSLSMILSASIAVHAQTISSSYFALPEGVSSSFASNAVPDLASSSSAASSVASSSAAGSASAEGSHAHSAPETVAPFSKFALGVSVGTLGITIQGATPIAQKLNLRVAGNFFSYNTATYTSDGISYSGTLNLRSAEATVDWFPFHNGFHISPGLLMYNGFGGTAKLSVGPGQGFELNKNDYTSSSTSPITGTGSVSANKAAPLILVGFSNLIPRSHRHISIPFEIGAAYQGSPNINLMLTGTACDVNGENCQPVSSFAALQSDLAAQIKKINHDASAYSFYPIFSIGFGYKF